MTKIIDNLLLLAIVVILIAISVNIFVHKLVHNKPCTCEIKQVQDDRPGNLQDEARKFLLRKGN